MQVEIKDRKEDVELFRMACNVAEIGIDYQTADLLLRISKLTDEKKGELSLSEVTAVRLKWSMDWNVYFETQ